MSQASKMAFCIFAALWCLCSSTIHAAPAALERNVGWKLYRSSAAAFPGQKGAQVAVYLPTKFRPTEQPLNVVAYFHGYHDTLEGEGPRHHPGIIDHPEYALAESMEQAGDENTILIVPQGPVPFDNLHPSWGQLDRPQGFEKLLNDVLQKLQADRHIGSANIAKLAIISHSGAFAVASRIADSPTLRGFLSHVVLLDSLYGCKERYVALAKRGVKIFVAYTDRGGTRANSESLRNKNITNVTVIRSDVSHNGTVGKYLPIFLGQITKDWSTTATQPPLPEAERTLRSDSGPRPAAQSTSG